MHTPHDLYTISYTTRGLPTGLKCVCGCCFICFLVWIVSLWGRWGGRKQNQHTHRGRSRINRWANKRANTHRPAVFTVTSLRPDCLHLSKLKAASTSNKNPPFFTTSSYQSGFCLLHFLCEILQTQWNCVIYIDTEQDLQPTTKNVF